jgi:hypothetical protein
MGFSLSPLADPSVIPSVCRVTGQWFKHKKKLSTYYVCLSLSFHANYRITTIPEQQDVSGTRTMNTNRNVSSLTTYDLELAASYMHCCRRWYTLLVQYLMPVQEIVIVIVKVNMVPDYLLYIRKGGTKMERKSTVTSAMNRREECQF